MKYTIEVTQSDIYHGCRRNSNSCPIALAIRRVIPKITDIEVDDTIIRIWTPGSRLVPYRALPNGEVAQFIRDFDRGLPVTPTTFKFDFKLPRIIN